jgi:hypothetical protein
MIVVPSRGPDDWKAFLADPKHWKEGRSAWELAHSWERAAGRFPAEVAAVLAREPQLADLEPLIVIPEYKVALVGGSRPSQTDAFVLAHGLTAGLATIAVEGKAGEDFGPLLSDWRREASPGKEARERQLVAALGVGAIPGSIRYQIVHRTASAVLEAERFGARYAVMLVQAFAKDDHFDDYAAFVGLFGARAERGAVVRLRERDKQVLWAGWVDSPNTDRLGTDEPHATRRTRAMSDD